MIFERNPFGQPVPEPAPARADDPVTARLRIGADDAASTAPVLPGARITALGTARRRRRILVAAGCTAVCVAVTGIGLRTYGADSRQPSVPPSGPPTTGSSLGAP
ncbi:hypothetical protein ACFY2H_41785 [Streptomyces griseofuscus]|uniref:hypothetical protein n=1 Tax=Streptomyces griseofuscus TaxID=146922 RepID=UPI00367E7A7B